jgi:hypothetical protein
MIRCLDVVRPRVMHRESNFLWLSMSPHTCLLGVHICILLKKHPTYVFLRTIIVSVSSRLGFIQAVFGFSFVSPLAVLSALRQNLELGRVLTATKREARGSGLMHRVK